MKNIFTFLMLLTSLTLCSAMFANIDAPTEKMGNPFALLMDNLDALGPCNNNQYNLILNGQIMDPATSSTTMDCSYIIDPANVLVGTNEVVIDDIEGASVLNGLTTLDLVLIYRGLTSGFMDIFETIAADFDGDQAVSTKDLIEMRRYILGIENELQYQNFKIVDAGLVASTDFGPFNLGSDFKSYIFSDNQLGGAPLQVRILKSGDVNGSALFAPEDNPVSREAATISFPDTDVVAGEIYNIHFDMNSSSTFQAASFELLAEGVEIISINENGNDLLFNNKTDAAAFSFFSTHPEYGFDFTIEVKAKADGKLSEMLSLNSDFYKEVVDIDSNVGGVSLSANGVTDTQEITYDLFDISPNPVTDVLNISFGESTNVGVSLIEFISMDGKSHYSYKTSASQFSIDVNALQTKGLHLIRVTQGLKTMVEKVIVY